MMNQHSNETDALIHFHALTSRVCVPIVGDEEYDLMRVVGGILSSVGEIQHAVARGWMQMDFSPVGLCLEIGKLSVSAVYLCEVFDWEYKDLFLDPETASDCEALAGAVLGRNPVALALVLGALAGDIADCIERGYSEEGELAALKFRVSLFVTASSLLSNMHCIDFVLSCLPETIDYLKGEYPADFADIAPMVRASKASAIYTGSESRH